MIRRMGFLIVNSDNCKFDAISLFVIPLATSVINLRCRHVRSTLPELRKSVERCHCSLEGHSTAAVAGAVTEKLVGAPKDELATPPPSPSTEKYQTGSSR